MHPSGQFLRVQLVYHGVNLLTLPKAISAHFREERLTLLWDAEGLGFLLGS